MNLRLPEREYSALEKLRFQGIGKQSANAWILDAVREKLVRDSVRESPTPSYGDGERTFYEFFAGAGMARMGLGTGWCCLFSNDFDPIKARTYRENWNGGRELLVDDVCKISTSTIPKYADLVWASFPCQDVSLAGKNAGIGSDRDISRTRSGTFWPFWGLIDSLANEGRKPKLVVLENVLGILTSRGGNDFAAIGSALANSGYRFGAVVIDAKMFVPQSRPRVFIVGIDDSLEISPELIAQAPLQPWHVEALLVAHSRLDATAQDRWLWWKLPLPKGLRTKFVDLLEEDPKGVDWHSSRDTKKLLGMMSSTHLERVVLAQRSGRRFVGGVYKRTRIDDNGKKIQRAEVRFDGIAGCLRTPSGGSSRQLVLVVEGSNVRSRLLSPREAARLMGLPDSYILPKNYNEAYHLCGDGVVTLVVGFLADNLLNVLIDSNRPQSVLPLRVA